MHARHVTCAVLAIGVLCASTTVGAHHAGSIQYDSTRPISLTGRITKIEWRYPHAGFTLDVTDTRGHIAAWEFVLEGPSNALRRGWTRTSLKIGDVVTVKGFPAKDRPLEARATDMTLSDGRPVVAIARPTAR